MLTPGWHNDTYAEEYHRALLPKTGAGGNLCLMRHQGLPHRTSDSRSARRFEATREPPCLPLNLRASFSLVRSTHNHPGPLRAATDLTRILSTPAGGVLIRDTISQLSPSRSLHQKVAQMGKFRGSQGRGKYPQHCLVIFQNPFSPLYISHGNTMTTFPLRSWQMFGWAVTIVTAAWFSDPSSHAVTECPIGGWTDYWLFQNPSCNFAIAVLRF